MHRTCNLGKEQAAITGKRLKLLEKPWDKIIKSTMTRAQETAEIISHEIGTIPVTENNHLIEEGQPIAPEPPGKDVAEPWVRIYYLFRKSTPKKQYSLYLYS